MSDFTIRDARWPEDEAATVSFIDGLQKFEYQFEPNRRIDPHVGADYFRELMKRVAENEGRVFVAEEDGAAVGWAVFLMEQQEVYVVESDRRTGYIAELFVDESARGTGVGKALIAACETHARAKGLNVLMIGVLPKNVRARAVYHAAGFSPYAEQLRKRL
ncbi:MAG TPA: GNAT family N-acetyltransferase [Rhizomicrobium sp.]|jgi:GNAT superfamily N-acetyltransferase